MNYGHAYILGNALQFGYLVAVRMCLYLRVHVYVYEVNSYEASSSKWYFHCGANKHPGMAIVESQEYIIKCDSIWETGEVVPSPVVSAIAQFTL